MRRVSSLLSVVFVALGASLPAQESDRKVIAPTSGGVDIERIMIVRQAARGAVKAADLTNMQIELRLMGDWKNQDLDSFDHLVWLRSLDPVEDNTGKLLSTPKRRKQIDYLEGEVRGLEWSGEAKGKGGPSIRLILDAPERSAVKIKAFQGRAEVTRARAVRLQFDDLSAIHGKELSHPDLPGLEKLKVRFSIETKEGEVTAKVAAPFNYSSPWFRGRLAAWSLMDGEGEIHLSSEGTSRAEGRFTVERTFRRPDFKGWSLSLVVLDPVESKTFDFEFHDIELP
jgi:hypothetical protein